MEELTKPTAQNTSIKVLQSQDQINDHINEDVERYLDMQMINPDWEFAKKHGNALHPGIVNHEADKKQECICCLKVVNKVPIPLCANSKQLEFLGYGFPLYFIFLKYLMILLLLLIVSYTFLGLNWAIINNHNFCILNEPLNHNGKSIKCTSYMVLFSRIQNEIDHDENILRISSFITILLGLIYIRDKIRKTNEYYDERSTNYSDFSLFVQNLPSKQEIKNDPKLKDKNIGIVIKEFLSDNQIFADQYKPIKIIFIGQLQTIQHLQEERRRIATLIGKIEFQTQTLKNKQSNKKQSNQVMPTQQNIEPEHLKINKKEAELKKQMQQIVKKIKEEKNKLANQLHKQEIDCDKAIICFKEQHERQSFQEAFNQCKTELLVKYFGAKANQIAVTQAPEPHQIIWENINLKASSHIKRTIISWVIFTIILGALTTSFYFLFKYKSLQIEQQMVIIQNDPEKASELMTKAKAIVYCSAILITCFNKFIFAYIIHHLIEFERHVTGQALQFSLCLKYTLGLFFTTAIMTLLVQGATTHNIYEEDYGIVQEETIMFYFSAFLVPAIWLINPWYILQWIKRQLYSGSKFLTQEQANKLMEDPQYLMGKRYGQLLQTVWFTFLYACVLPFGSILVFFGLGLYYWVDKYNLLRKSTVTEGLAVKINLQTMTLLDFIVVLKPAGELIFDRLLKHDWQVISVIELAVGVAYLIMPINQILDFFHHQDFRGTTKNYFDLQKSNILNYQLYNPLTKQHQLRKHFERIQVCSDYNHLHSHYHIKQSTPLVMHEHTHYHQHKTEYTIGGKTSKKRIYAHKKQYAHSIIRPHINSSQKQINSNDVIQKKVKNLDSESRSLDK